MFEQESWYTDARSWHSVECHSDRMPQTCVVSFKYEHHQDSHLRNREPLRSQLCTTWAHVFACRDSARDLGCRARARDRSRQVDKKVRVRMEKMGPSSPPKTVLFLAAHSFKTPQGDPGSLYLR